MKNNDFQSVIYCVIFNMNKRLLPMSRFDTYVLYCMLVAWSCLLDVMSCLPWTR